MQLAILHHEGTLPLKLSDLSNPHHPKRNDTPPRLQHPNNENSRLVIVPRWADAPASLRPVTPTGYSFRLRHGFLTVLIRGRGHEEREKRFVGLFHLTHSDGLATLVVEYTGQARAIAPTAAPDSST